MPATCILTGKKSRIVNKRSKSMQGTKTRVKANLQKVKIGNKKYWLSTRAMRTLNKKPLARRAKTNA